LLVPQLIAERGDEHGRAEWRSVFRRMKPRLRRAARSGRSRRIGNASGLPGRVGYHFHQDQSRTNPMRLDKWLWAARFFKTRGLASDALDGGKVKINGVAAKPAKEVRPGDTLHIRAGEQDWEVVVRGLNAQRRPAAEAQQLYEETAPGRQRREQALALRRLSPAPGGDHQGRPTKRERRQMERFRS
jgi:ribosome-associated heat shock protein Hsp15